MVTQNIVFFGTSAVGLPFLELLLTHFNVALVVSQPDALGGRNRKQVLVPPVKTFALAHGLPLTQPESLSGETLVSLAETIRAIDPVIGVVISYGQFIPQTLIAIPPHRMVNVHFSMLPRWRGAAPVQRALENGESATGITIFEIVKKMDAGDIWAQREMAIFPHETTDALWDRMSREGAPFLIDTLDAILDHRIQKFPQDPDRATHAPAVRKEEGRVDWHLTAQQIYNRFRAFHPWPGLTAYSGGDDVKTGLKQEFKLTAVAVSPLTHASAPGEVLSWDKHGLHVCCGEGTVLAITELVPQGKKPMSPYSYSRGNALPSSFD
ncbi:MAG: methionyl-tRNA formyltransferase [Candidatus Omnitrophota bacterium]